MTFQKKDALTNHAKTHLNDTLHKCFVCEKTFPNEKVRDQHAAKHKGQLPHKCELCQMTFQSRSQLIRHATSHTKTGGCTAAVAATTVASVATPAVPAAVLAAAAAPPPGSTVTFVSAAPLPTVPMAAPAVVQAAAQAAATQGTDNKINSFLESFSASLGEDMFGEEAYDAATDQDAAASLAAGTEIIDPAKGSLGEFVDNSLRMSADLEDAAAEAALAFAPDPETADLLAEEPAAASAVRSFQCDICMTKLPADKHAYVTHMKMHASSMTLKCSFCPQVFQGKYFFMSTTYVQL